MASRQGPISLLADHEVTWLLAMGTANAEQLDMPESNGVHSAKRVLMQGMTPLR